MNEKILCKFGWLVYVYILKWFFHYKILVLKLYVKGVNFSICFLLIINVSRETIKILIVAFEKYEIRFKIRFNHIIC